MTAAHVIGSPHDLAQCPGRTPEQDAAWWLSDPDERHVAELEGRPGWSARMASRWASAVRLGWPHTGEGGRWARACDAAWAARVGVVSDVGAAC